MGSKSIQNSATLELSVPVPSTDLFSHSCSAHRSTTEVVSLSVDFWSASDVEEAVHSPVPFSVPELKAR